MADYRCPFAEKCARLGGICQCAEERQEDDEDRRRQEVYERYAYGTPGIRL